MGLDSCLCCHFESSLLSLCTHCVNPLRWLQSSSRSIPHRQVVCSIQIKTIIFHACTHTASASYTFTCYYLSELSWLRSTRLQIKRREMCQNPTLSSCGAFLESLDAQFSLQSAPSLNSSACWDFSTRQLAPHRQTGTGELRWASPRQLKLSARATKCSYKTEVAVVTRKKKLWVEGGRWAPPHTVRKWQRWFSNISFCVWPLSVFVPSSC